MRASPVIDATAGTTIKTFLVNSGVTPTTILSRLLDNSETLVSSFSPVNSGNGFYFALHTLPNTQAWYVNEWQCTIDGYPYVSRQYVRSRIMRGG